MYDYERKQLLIIKPEHEKQVVAVPVPGGGTYAVSAKVTVEGRSTLRARCSLSMLPPLEEEEDVARATISAFESLDPTQTLYLQHVYRLPLRTGLKIFRVRCRNNFKSEPGSYRSIELSNASIQALRLQYALK